MVEINPLAEAVREEIQDFVERDFTRYVDNAVGFAYDVLKIKYLTPQQIDILHSLEKNKYTAIQSGHGLGKSWLMAVIVLWFLYTRKPSKIITSAPAKDQTTGVIWNYIKSFHSKADLFGKLTSGKLVLGTVNDEPDWYAEGITTKDANSFQGRHSPNMMILFDEAVGIPSEFWEAGKSMVMSPSDRMVAVGNPTTTACQFYLEKETDLWHWIRLNCYDHPNVVEGKELVKGAVTKQWIEERIKDFGGTHTNQFRSRVLGLFPTQEMLQVIPEGFWENCAKTDKYNPVDYDSEKPLIVSGDISSGGGDEASFCEIYRDGFVIIKAFSNFDEHKCYEYLKKYAGIIIVVDDIGVGGAVSTFLEKDGIKVERFNSNKPSEEKDLFFNLRSHSAFLTRQTMQNRRIQINPNDDKLRKQLLAFRRDETSPKWRLESKLETKKRIGMSPDRADSLFMAVFHWVKYYKDLRNSVTGNPYVTSNDDKPSAQNNINIQQPSGLPNVIDVFSSFDKSDFIV